MKIRTLTQQGTAKYEQWLASRRVGEMPPSSLRDGVDDTAAAFDVEIDPDRSYLSRYEFAEYMAKVLCGVDTRDLFSHTRDGVWNWITVVYFSQFGKKVSMPWHYAIKRRGHAGSLAYRHIARTSVEMHMRHLEYSLVMLNGDLSTWGDMSEQLTSRQNVSHHRGYIKAANSLYMENGKLRRGAAGRVPPKAKRKDGDRRGKGGAARLALAVRRLCRTYDTHDLETAQMIDLLPKEFGLFKPKSKPESPAPG